MKGKVYVNVEVDVEGEHSEHLRTIARGLALRVDDALRDGVLIRGRSVEASVYSGSGVLWRGAVENGVLAGTVAFVSLREQAPATVAAGTMRVEAPLGGPVDVVVSTGETSA